jgi:polyisoprenoid-binding protein YceI
MHVKIFLLPVVCLLSPVWAGEWKVDADKAKVEFSVHGMFGTVHGTFTGLKATIRFDEKNPGAGSISASVDAKTVSTGIGLRNHHLRTEEQYFNTDKYPTISFRSTKIEKAGNGYTAAGDLKIKDVTKAIRLPFTFSGSGNSGVFKGHFVLKREDYNLGKPGGSVGDEVTVDLTVPATQ